MQLSIYKSTYVACPITATAAQYTLCSIACLIKPQFNNLEIGYYPRKRGDVAMSDRETRITPNAPH